MYAIRSYYEDTKTTKAYEKSIREAIEPFTDIPIVFISVLNKQRIYKAIRNNFV